MSNNENQYVLYIEGESDTIGNLIVKTTDELYPDVEAITYSTTAIGRSLTIKIIYGDDINTLYRRVIDHLTAIFETIKGQL
jgi:DNA-directed RNA polymerase subunit L